MIRLLRWLLLGTWKPAENPDEALAVKVATLEVELHGLRTEWADVLDKITRWSARENARKRRAVQKAMGEGEALEAGAGEIVEPGASQAPGQSRKAYLRSLIHNGRGR